MFFIDRSLGRKRVPQGLRDVGWTVVTLAEHYGQPADESVTDDEWLTVAGDRGWAVLMKDDRIRYRDAERRALIGSGVHAFCLASGNLRSVDMVDLYAGHRLQIFATCREPGPSLHVLSRAGMRRVDLG